MTGNTVRCLYLVPTPWGILIKTNNIDISTLIQNNSDIFCRQGGRNLPADNTYNHKNPVS